MRSRAGYMRREKNPGQTCAQQIGGQQSTLPCVPPVSGSGDSWKGYETVSLLLSVEPLALLNPSGPLPFRWPGKCFTLTRFQWKDEHKF